MQVTAKTEYAMRAMVDLASRSGEACTVAQVAKRQSIPGKILPGIIRALAAAGLVDTARGFGGGVRLARAADAISVNDVWEAVEGPLEMGRCDSVGRPCPVGLGEDCPLRGLWERTQSRMVQEWEGTTLSDLVGGRHSGRGPAKRTGRRAAARPAV